MTQRKLCPVSDIGVASAAKKAQRFRCHCEAAMNRFVTRENIERYRRLASGSTDSTERSRIMKLLADEGARFRLEQRRRGDASEARSAVNAATENWVEHDGRKQ